MKRLIYFLLGLILLGSCSPELQKSIQKTVWDTALMQGVEQVKRVVPDSEFILPYDSTCACYTIVADEFISYKVNHVVPGQQISFTRGIDFVKLFQILRDAGYEFIDKENLVIRVSKKSKNK